MRAIAVCSFSCLRDRSCSVRHSLLALALQRVPPAPLASSPPAFALSLLHCVSHSAVHVASIRERSGRASRRSGLLTLPDPTAPRLAPYYLFFLYSLFFSTFLFFSFSLSLFSYLSYFPSTLFSSSFTLYLLYHSHLPFSSFLITTPTTFTPPPPLHRATAKAPSRRGAADSSSGEEGLIRTRSRGVRRSRSPPPLQALGPTRLHHFAQTGACPRCGSRVGISSRRSPRSRVRTRPSSPDAAIRS